MSDEFKDDIGKTVQFFMKTGRVYTGKIEAVSKNEVIRLTDKFDKPVKIKEDDWSSVEYKK